MSFSTYLVRAALASFAALSLSACGSDDTRSERLALAGPNPDLAALLKVADAKIGARKFSTCAGCHHIRPGAPDIGGPNLYGVMGKTFATNSATFGYTAPLRDYGGQWDAATMDRWMQNPTAMIPATSMRYDGMADALDRADVIAYMLSRSE